LGLPFDHDLSWAVQARLADHSTISRLSVEARKAGARGVGDCMAHDPQEETKKPRVRGSMPFTVSFSDALGLAMMECSCERQMGHGAKLEDGIYLCAAFACRRGYINPLYFLL